MDSPVFSQAEMVDKSLREERKITLCFVVTVLNLFHLEVSHMYTVT